MEAISRWQLVLSKVIIWWRSIWNERLSCVWLRSEIADWLDLFDCRAKVGQTSQRDPPPGGRQLAHATDPSPGPQRPAALVIAPPVLYDRSVLRVFTFLTCTGCPQNLHWRIQSGLACFRQYCWFTTLSHYKTNRLIFFFFYNWSITLKEIMYILRCLFHTFYVYILYHIRGLFGKLRSW